MVFEIISMNSIYLKRLNILKLLTLSLRRIFYFFLIDLQYLRQHLTCFVDTAEPNSFTLNPIPEKQTNLTEKSIKMLSRLIPHLKNVPKRSYMNGLGSRSEQNRLPRVSI